MISWGVHEKYQINLYGFVYDTTWIETYSKLLNYSFFTKWQLLKTALVSLNG